MHLGWEAMKRADEIAERVGAALANAGFEATVVTAPSDAALVCLTARD